MVSFTSQSECGMLPHKRHFVMFAAEHTAFFSTFILYSKTSLLTYFSIPHTSISQRQSSTLGSPIRLCMIIGMRGGSSREQIVLVSEEIRIGHKV